ncbi:MAG: UTP--glucose-1-phosphate uridylyltransferase [Fibromonadaceae bacterium]|jgi:phosphomannomutase|nr:UTP--glucose-1-phosphate uridylyltransferase [Fibromonadaceae bacterium]
MLISELMDKSGVAFGTSGARGLVLDMTDEVCFAYTLGFLQHTLKNKNAKKIAAFGGDLRPSTPRIIAACMAAAKSLGFECDYQGFLPSPALALYSIKKGIPSIMVTGSHIPSNRNGIKFCDYYGEITKADEQSIRAQEIQIPGNAGGSPTQECPPATNGEALKIYKEHILSLFPKNALQNTNIALYQHSAVGRDIALEILQELGANAKALGRSELFIPVDTEAIRQEDIDFAKETCASGEFFCVASTDGDSDRPLISDEKGNWLRGDSLGILAAKALCIEAVAIPVSCNTAAEKGLFFKEVLRTKIGSPFVIEGIKELEKKYKCVAGFEANGGFLTQALTTRDALTPIIATIIECKKQGLKLSEFLAKLPSRYTSSDLVKEFPPELAAKKLQELQEQKNAGEFANIAGTLLSINATDGYRMEFESGNIVHLRKSGNAPEFRCYTESKTEEEADLLNSKCITVLENWKSLDKDMKSQDWGLLAELAKMAGEQLAGNLSAVDETIVPMDFEMLGASPHYSEFENAGKRILQNGEAAAFLLAGGQGSRLGFNGPKGIFKLEAIGKTIFQIHAERLHKLKELYGKDIPWIIMTSPLNNKETLEYFEQANYFGLNKEKIKFIEQGTICALTPDGKPIFENEGHLALVPDGSGGCFRALSQSGALDFLERQGIKFLFVYGVDNILAKPCDPAFMGAFEKSGKAAASKVVRKKYPEEKMGVFVLKNNLPAIIEYSEVPKERMSEFMAGNIVAHLFTMDSLKKLKSEPLPWHLAVKKVCGVDGALKFEQFIFDVFPLLGTMLLTGVLREEEFAPIKNASGEDSPESAMELFCHGRS